MPWAYVGEPLVSVRLGALIGGELLHELGKSAISTKSNESMGCLLDPK